MQEERVLSGMGHQPGIDLNGCKPLSAVLFPAPAPYLSNIRIDGIRPLHCRPGIISQFDLASRLAASSFALATTHAKGS